VADTKPQPAARYLHGTAPSEQDRLGLMNALLNENSLREMKLAAGEITPP